MRGSELDRPRGLDSGGIAWDPAPSKSPGAINRAVVSVDNVRVWRSEILQGVIEAICSPRQRLIQRDSGLWGLWDAIPYPQQQNVVIVENGSINFPVSCGAGAVMFTVSLQVGEVRIGALIPREFLGKSEEDAQAERQRLRMMFDEDNKARHSAVGFKAKELFEWVFRSDFAGFQFCHDSLMDMSRHDRLRMSVIVERVQCILMHLYMAVISELVAVNNFRVALTTISPDGVRPWSTVVVGALHAFEAMCAKNGWRLQVAESIPPDVNGWPRCKAVVWIPKDIEEIPQRLPIRDEATRDVICMATNWAALESE